MRPPKLKKALSQQVRLTSRGIARQACKLIFNLLRKSSAKKED